MSDKIKLGIILSFLLILIPAVLAEDTWVLKGTRDGDKIICEEAVSCINPNVAIGDSSADITVGWTEGECSGEKQLKGSWTTPPSNLVPGEKIETNLEASVYGSTTCEGYGGFITLYTGFYMSKIQDENLIRPPTGRVDVMSAGGYLPDGPHKDSRIISWTVPSGNPGDELDLLFGSSTGAIGGFTHFIYEYGEVGDPVPMLISEPEPINLPKSVPIKESANKECIDSGARLSDYNGNVEVAPPSNLNDWDLAELGMVLCEGSAIKTGIESEAILSFSDMTQFVMKPETHIIISVAVKQHSKIALVAGNIWMNVKKMLKDGSMEVKMSQAVAGIKGTTFVLEETGTESTIKVIEGTVEFTSLADKSIELVSGGETITATSNGLSEKTTFDIDEESKLWNATPSSNFWFYIIGLIIIGALAFYFVKKK